MGAVADAAFSWAQLETINKLLKKQAPKGKGRHPLAGEETSGEEVQRASPTYIRWISSREGSRVAIPDDMVAGPMGQVFGLRPGGGGKMVEEVL